jgi:hypothetical protein
LTGLGPAGGSLLVKTLPNRLAEADDEAQVGFLQLAQCTTRRGAA